MLAPLSSMDGLTDKCDRKKLSSLAGCSCHRLPAALVIACRLLLSTYVLAPRHRILRRFTYRLAPSHRMLRRFTYRLAPSHRILRQLTHFSLRFPFRLHFYLRFPFRFLALLFAFVLAPSHRILREFTYRLAQTHIF